MGNDRHKYIESGQKFLKKRDFQKAIISFSQALALAKALKDLPSCTIVKTFLMKALYHKQEVKIALDYGRTIDMKYLKSISDQKRYYTYMANCLGMLGLEKDSIKYFEYLETLDDPKAMFNSYVGRGILLWRQNEDNKKYSEAVEMFEKAEQIAVLDKDRFYVFCNLAELHSEFGQHQEALISSDLSMQYANSEENLSAAFNIRGIIFYKCSRMDEAIDCLDKSLKICNKNNDLIRKGYNYKWRGYIYKTQKKYIPAIEEFEKALQLLKEKDIMKEVAECCWELYDLYKERNKSMSINYKIEAESYLKAIKVL